MDQVYQFTDSSAQRRLGTQGTQREESCKEGEGVGEHDVRGTSSCSHYEASGAMGRRTMLSSLLSLVASLFSILFSGLWFLFSSFPPSAYSLPLSNVRCLPIGCLYLLGPHHDVVYNAKRI